MFEADHTKDEDCQGFIVAGCCTACGVGHDLEYPCKCGGTGFHKDGCPESDGYEVPHV